MRPRTSLRQQAREIRNEEKKLIIDPDKAASELCKRRLSFFVKEFWSVIIPDELIWNWHLDVLCDELQKVYERVIGYEEPDPLDPKKTIRRRLPKLYDLIINIPPGTSKSTVCTIMAPAWSWTRDPSLRHITGSYSDALATEHSVKSRDIIKSDKYRIYFPEVVIKRDEDNKTNFKTTKNGQRYATSTGGTVTGMHAHIITIDDPLNPKQAASDVQLAEANAWFDKTISTRKVDKEVTSMILIMQRLATNDPTGHLIEKKGETGIRWVCLPGTLGDNVRPIEYRSNYKNGLLDERRLSLDALKDLRIELGSDGYAGQIDQNPVPVGGLIWQKWFLEVPDINFPDKKYFTEYGTDWDLAYTKDDVNAASAYVTGGKIGTDIYIDDIGWDWLEFPELVAWMKTKHAPHYIEAKASGKSAKQSLVRLGINAIEVKVEGGQDKISRAKMATPPAEAGRVFIRQSLADKLYNDHQQGILFFPRGKYKDLADALAQFILRLDKKNGYVVSTGGESSILDFLK